MPEVAGNAIASKSAFAAAWLRASSVPLTMIPIIKNGPGRARGLLEKYISAGAGKYVTLGTFHPAFISTPIIWSAMTDASNVTGNMSITARCPENSDLHHFECSAK
jgi:hypothetical protein